MSAEEENMQKLLRHREKKTKTDSLLQMRHWQHAKSCCSLPTLKHSLPEWTWKD